MFTFYILSYRIVFCMCVYDMLYLLNQFVPMEQYVDERKIQQSQENSCSRYFHGRRKEHRILTSSIGFGRGLYQLVTHVTHGSLVWVYFVPVCTCDNCASHLGACDNVYTCLHHVGLHLYTSLCVQGRRKLQSKCFVPLWLNSIFGIKSRSMRRKECPLPPICMYQRCIH